MFDAFDIFTHRIKPFDN